jgi:hypothetical protein
LSGRIRKPLEPLFTLRSWREALEDRPPQGDLRGADLCESVHVLKLHTARGRRRYCISRGIVDKCSYRPERLVCTAWTARHEHIYARPMAQPFVLRERWFDVSLPEFEAFLRDYPRPLEARPPLTQKANYREWCDPTLGNWPGNAVAKRWARGGCHGYQVRLISR